MFARGQLREPYEPAFHRAEEHRRPRPPRHFGRGAVPTYHGRDEDEEDEDEDEDHDFANEHVQAANNFDYGFQAFGGDAFRANFNQQPRVGANEPATLVGFIRNAFYMNFEGWQTSDIVVLPGSMLQTLHNNPNITEYVNC